MTVSSLVAGLPQEMTQFMVYYAKIYRTAVFIYGKIYSTAVFICGKIYSTAVFICGKTCVREQFGRYRV